MFKKYTDRLIKTITLPINDIRFNETDILALIKDENSQSYYDYKTELVGLLSVSSKPESLNETRLIFEKYHPLEEIRKSEDIYKYYLRFIEKIACSFIAHRDGKIVFKYWKSSYDTQFEAYSDINKVLLWHSFNRAITSDFLIASYMLANRIDYMPDQSQIFMADMQLEQVLNKGMSDTHIHLTAASNFYISWIRIMNMRYDELIKLKERNFYIDTSLANSYVMKDLLENILYYSLMRFMLSVYIQRFAHMKDKDSEKIDLQVKLKKYKGLKAYELNQEREKLFSGFKLVDEDEKNDILKTVYVGDRPLSTSYENEFLYKALKLIKEEPSVSIDEFSKHFFEYLRFKNEIYRIMIFSSEIKGLDIFEKYFRRGTSIGSYYKNYYRSMLEIAFEDPNLKKFEMRISSGAVGRFKTKDEFKRNMRINLIQIFEGYQSIIEERIKNYDKLNETIDLQLEEIKVPLIGIIFHFIKQYENLPREKCWVNHLNTRMPLDNSYLSYETIIESYRIQAEAIKELRHEIAFLDKYVVGIDAANVEHYADPWVFSDIYDQIRDSQVSYRDLHGQGIQSLGFTYHVGEEFTHLMTGLRKISEVVEHFHFHAGDRIGHGIALGVSPEQWRDDHRVIILPRIEYLENLLWIWGCCKDEYGVLDITYIERLIMDRAFEIYGGVYNLNVYDLWKAYKGKFKRFEPNIKYLDQSDAEDNFSDLFCQCCKFEGSNMWNAEKLQHAYHCKKYICKMLEPIQIEISEKEVFLLKYMQDYLKRIIKREGIVVETNPSSNVILGEQGNIFEHHILNLNAVEEGDNIMATINTDDPMIFNTNLSNEFAYIYYALIEKGYCKESILKWIDKIRNYGMETSFIRNRSKSVGLVQNEIKTMIDQLSAQN